MPGTALEAWYNNPRKKTHLGRKARKNVKGKSTYRLDSKKQGLDRKRKKPNNNQQSWQNPVNSSQWIKIHPFTTPYRRQLSPTNMFKEEIGAESLVEGWFSQSEASSADAAHWCGTKSKMNDFEKSHIYHHQFYCKNWFEPIMEMTYACVIPG